LAGKAARRRIRHLGSLPKSAGKAPHLSGAGGIGRICVVQDSPPDKRHSSQLDKLLTHNPIFGKSKEHGLQNAK
jgi:hypothetical protein